MSHAQDAERNVERAHRIIATIVLTLILLFLFLVSTADAFPPRFLLHAPLDPTTPLVAGWTYGGLTAWAGCHAKLFSLPYKFINAGHSEGEMIVVTRGLLEASRELQFLVMLHELTHCTQHRRGELETYHPSFPLEVQRLEQEADIVAVNTACSLGLDGIGYMRELASHLSVSYGMTADERFQTAVSRAVSCRRAQETR